MSKSCGLRWLRILAIGTSAIILASCRSLTAPALMPIAAVVHSEEAQEAEASPEEPDTVRQAGLEVPCAPLPRLPRHGLRPGRCLTGRCATGMCSTGACSTGNCQPVACLPPPAVPVVGPYLVCDGGDHAVPAKPIGRFGIKNLTAGDTVARYRPADAVIDPDGDEAADACLTTSNCACVYAPRFASVREVIRPHEEAAPVGPKGLAVDALAEAAVDNLPVLGRTHSLVPEAARKSQPLLAVEERLPPLAVDQNDLPTEADSLENPVERVLDEQPLLASLVQTPRIKVGFDVPFAWTCVTAAQVTVNNQTAEVIAADSGTATLRLEEPGRCELTLCKRAGSDTARVGEELDFTIFLLNSGDRPLNDIVLVDAIPTRLELIPDSAASNLPADISTEAGDDGSVVLTWRVQHTLRPGESGFVRFRTIVR
jgi:uncharacterized repeat protein (TIGR01451 family)